MATQKLKHSLNFALLGCGRIARKHATVITKQLPEANLVAVCDIDPKQARMFSEHYNVPSYTDLDSMMQAKGDEIDVVNVLTPTGNHSSNVIDISKYGKHVVVEKPMALTLGDAESMIEACNSAEVKLFIMKQNRYNLPVKKLHEAITKGRFGRIFLATTRVRWCRDQSYYDQAKWRGTWLLDGGVFANQASHHIDLLNWLAGDVDTVFAYVKKHLADIETEDTGIALLKFRCGALGIVEATTATRPYDLEASISILGEKGTVEIGGFAVNKIKVWQFEESLPEDEDVINNYSQNPPDIYGFGHEIYLQHVIDCIIHNSPIMVDGLEGMKSLRIINAIYESAESGAEVAVNKFVPKYSRLGKAALL